MKTLVYGAGPIGRFYTFFLQQAGKDVTILARNKTYSFIKENGIVLVEGYSGEKKSANVKVVNKLNPQDDYDLVLVAMPKAARLSICPILSQSKKIRHILFVGNDVSGFNLYSEFLQIENVLLGFPRVGGGVIDNEVTYVDREEPNGKRDPLFLGELDGQIKDRTKQIKVFFESAEIPVKLVKDMDGWLKYHFAFIAPIAGVYFKCNRDFKAIQNDKDAIRTYIRASKEAGNVLKAIGYTQRQPFIFNMYYWNPEWLNVKIFRDKFFGSTYVKVAIGLHANAMGHELIEMVEEFRKLQDRASVNTPNLDELISHFPISGSFDSTSRRTDSLKVAK